MRVAVIGQGYVGLPLALAVAKAGHEVLGFDLNQDLVDSLNRGISHIEDIDSIELSTLVNAKSYRASSETAALRGIDVAIIAVPTPLNSDRKPDISFVESASRILGESLDKSSLIVNESTSFPGTLRKIISPIVNEYSQLGVLHKFAVSPERVDPGNKKWTIENTPRLVSGLTEEASEQVFAFYSTFCKQLTLVSSPEIAETSKLFENTFRQVNIALVNELAEICHALEIPIDKVLNAADTKPYGFMKFVPGIGVGGHCIPVDPIFLSFSAAQAGVNSKFIELADDVNNRRPKVILEQVKKDFNLSLNGKRVLLVGIAYKRNISDLRESPSLTLLKLLRDEGSLVEWHDPLVESFNCEKSWNNGNEKFDIVIFSMLHDIMDIDFLSSKGDLLIDLTGKIDSGIRY